MKHTTSLTLVAIGAILTFAITAHLHFLNLRVVGVVIMAVGVAGLFLPRSGFGWLRRRVVLSEDGRTGEVQEERFPSYVMLNPAALDAVQPHEDLVSDELDQEVQGPPADDESAEDLAEYEIAPRAAKNPHGSEMVAEFNDE